MKKKYLLHFLQYQLFLAYAGLRHRNKVKQLALSRLKTDTIICIGNGPSLSQQDLRSLSPYSAILTNRAYLLLSKFTPNGYINLITDEVRLAELKGLLPPHSLVYSSTSFLDALKALGDPNFILPHTVFDPEVKYGYAVNLAPKCSNSWQRLYLGRSVIFSAIQLAILCGARRIICLGIDMDYTGPHTHFTPARHVFQAFDYELHAHATFEVLHTECQRRGIQLLNATPGGRVRALPRIDLNSLSTCKSKSSL